MCYKFSLKFFAAVIILFFTSNVWSYPDFIAYGYRSCLTCHFNGSGGGALNDYGRAVWASEITSKAFLFGHLSDEKLGETSGFLGKPEKLPWWIRPGVKARQLYFVRDPGSKDAIESSITMQQEINAAFFRDKEQKIMFYGSYGYRPLQEKYKKASYVGKKPNEWITREHYMRYMHKENLHFYVGLMDKVFGIKNVDHKSFSREETQLTMDDQTHGATAHWIKENYEVTGQYYIGNLQQKSSLRPEGFTIHFDKPIGEKAVWGLSYLSEGNDYMKRQMYSAQYRTGLRNAGNGFLGEIGLVDEKPKGQNGEQGVYTFFQAMSKFTRGYHMLLKFETWKADISNNSPESFKYGFGLLSFPWLRTEFRIDVYNQRTIVPGTANADTWLAMAQLHLSL